MKKNMKTYFITGVMGFVGSHWAEKILKMAIKLLELIFMITQNILEIIKILSSLKTQ